MPLRDSLIQARHINRVNTAAGTILPESAQPMAQDARHAMDSITGSRCVARADRSPIQRGNLTQGQKSLAVVAIEDGVKAIKDKAARNLRIDADCMR